MIKKITLKVMLLLICATVSFACRDHENPSLPGSAEVETESASMLPFADTAKIDSSQTKKETIREAESSDVWVCKSAGAKRYHHNPDCGGLKRCTHEVVKQSVKEAEAVGLTQCSFKKCR